MDNYSQQASFVLVSRAQYHVMSAIGVFSGILSLVGSVILGLLVLKNAQQQPKAVFERIMLGVCAADIVGTLANLPHPFFLPRYTDLPYAIGNQTTCQILGFFFHAFMVSSIYSMELSFYFWLSTQSRQKQGFYHTVMEPWIHVLPWSVGTLFATVSIVLDAIHPSLVLGVCVADCPIDHITWECTSQKVAPHILRICVAGIYVGTAIVGISFLVLLHRHVKQQERINAQYEFPQGSAEQTHRQQTRRMKATFIQALFYASAFLNSLVAVSIALLGKEVLYSLLGLTNNWIFFLTGIYTYTMFPLQGFLNFIVFVRPKLMRWRDARSEKSYIWCLHQVLQGNAASELSSECTSPRQVEASSDGEGQ